MVPTVAGQARPLDPPAVGELASRLNTLISLSPQIPPLRPPGRSGLSVLLMCLPVVHVSNDPRDLRPFRFPALRHRAQILSVDPFSGLA